MTAPVSDPVVEDVSTLSDEEIMRRIEAEMASRPGPRQITIGEQFTELVGLVGSVTGKLTPRGVKVSEQTATKILELTLFWALNTRGGPAPSILPSEVGESGEEPVDEFPIPTEVVEAAVDQTQES